MITAGIDVGAEVVKVVLWKDGKDGKVIVRSSALSGRDKSKAAEAAFSEALKKAKISRDEVKKVFATGVGAKRAVFAAGQVSDAAAGAKGVTHLFPTVKTVIDVGAEEGRGIRCDATGKVVDFAVNEKCAAGAGAFTEAMARALEVKVEEMGKLSLQSQKSVPMNAQCAVFSESEVVSLIHAKTPKPDIAHAIHEAIAGRISSMVRTIGVEEDVALIGGLAKNEGFVDALKSELKVKLVIPENPEYISALGAALAAAEQK